MWQVNTNWGIYDSWCGGCPCLHMVWWMSYFTHGVVDVEQSLYPTVFSVVVIAACFELVTTHILRRKSDDVDMTYLGKISATVVGKGDFTSGKQIFRSIFQNVEYFSRFRFIKVRTFLFFLPALAALYLPWLLTDLLIY